MMVLAEAGAVQLVEAMPEADGWAVWITHTGLLGERREALERQRGGVRVFATLDAVAAALARAGILTFQVQTTVQAQPP